MWENRQTNLNKHAYKHTHTVNIIPTELSNRQLSIFRFSHGTDSLTACYMLALMKLSVADLTSVQSCKLTHRLLHFATPMSSSAECQLSSARNVSMNDELEWSSHDQLTLSSCPAHGRLLVVESIISLSLNLNVSSCQDKCLLMPT